MSDPLIDRLAGVLTDEEFARLSLLRQPQPPPPISTPIINSPNLVRLVSPHSNYLAHAYSTRNPWNVLHGGLLMEHARGDIGLHEGNGNFYDILPRLKPAGRNDGGFVWSRHEPNWLYTTEGNELRVFDIGADWNTQPTLVHKFTDYQYVNIGGGEGDISDDGDFLPLIGDGNKAFLFRLSTKSIVGIPTFLPNLNACYVTPSNRLIATGGFGVSFVESGNLGVTIAYKQEHMDVGRDVDGQEIIVWLDDRTNDIVKIRLNDIDHPTTLLSLGWSPLGGPESMTPHVCLPFNKPYAIISTYGRDLTMRHANQVLLVPLNGNAPTILAYHHSDTTSGNSDQRYSGQPRAVSSDKQFLFNARENNENVVYIGSL